AGRLPATGSSRLLPANSDGPPRSRQFRCCKSRGRRGDDGHVADNRKLVAPPFAALQMRTPKMSNAGASAMRLATRSWSRIKIEFPERVAGRIGRSFLSNGSYAYSRKPRHLVDERFVAVAVSPPASVELHDHRIERRSRQDL